MTAPEGVPDAIPGYCPACGIRPADTLVEDLPDGPGFLCASCATAFRAGKLSVGYPRPGV